MVIIAGIIPKTDIMFGTYRIVPNFWKIPGYHLHRFVLETVVVKLHDNN